jgi:thiosulfate/3-mercaptopyruvate sulfurtransferase
VTTRLVDCRTLEDYRDGHLPGAVHLDREQDLTGEVGDAGRGRHPLPDAATFAGAASRAGIDAHTFVLAYDAGDGWAQRCWWLLRHFGHDRAGTFDLRAYDGPFETAESTVESTVFEPHERTDDTIDVDEIARRLDDPQLVLADARSPERWRGDVEPLDPVAGRIPGAWNAFFEQPLPTGLNEASEIAVYCGSGVTACVPLQQLILGGRQDARLYPGSFSEWCRRPDTPIEKGDPQ